MRQKLFVNNNILTGKIPYLVNTFLHAKTETKIIFDPLFNSFLKQTTAPQQVIFQGSVLLSLSLNYKTLREKAPSEVTEFCTQLCVTRLFFLSLLSRNFDDQLSSYFHRCVNLCICWDTLSEKTGLWQLPTMSSVQICLHCVKRLYDYTCYG